jgi:hypothetical protein
MCVCVCMCVYVCVCVCVCVCTHLGEEGTEGTEGAVPVHTAPEKVKRVEGLGDGGERDIAAGLKDGFAISYGSDGSYGQMEGGLGEAGSPGSAPPARATW